mgnify:CR=1 FL=1
MAATGVTIAYLADYPQHAPVIAEWVFRHWGRMYRMPSLEWQIERISERLNKDRLPIAFVALASGEPVGTASLKIREMTTHTSNTGWARCTWSRPRAIAASALRSSSTPNPKRADSESRHCTYIHPTRKLSTLNAAWLRSSVLFTTK